MVQWSGWSPQGLHDQSQILSETVISSCDPETPLGLCGAVSVATEAIMIPRWLPHFYYLGMFDNLWSTSCCKTSKTKTHFVPSNIFRLLVERSKASRWYLWNLHHTVSRVTTACSSKCYCSILIFKFAYRSHDLSRPASGDFRAKFAARCHFKRGGPMIRHPTTADPSSLLTKDCAFRSWIKSNIETLTWTNELHQIRILLLREGLQCPIVLEYRETKFWPTSNSRLEVTSNMRVYMSWIMLDPFDSIPTSKKVVDILSDPRRHCPSWARIPAIHWLISWHVKVWAFAQDYQPGSCMQKGTKPVNNLPPAISD